jgi:nitroreductase
LPKVESPVMKIEETETILRAIETLRSVRSFRPDPVPKETLNRILRAASMAASGSNTQPWEFVVVQDAAVKARLKEPMLRKWLERMSAATRMNQRMKETYDEATDMLRNSEKVPVLIYCCLDLNRIGRGEEVRYASIYPAVQNLMLAAYALGLGTCLTIHGSTPTRGEPEVKLLLGMPENIKIACLVYIGYPSHRYGRPKRKPIEDHVHFDKW